MERKRIGVLFSGGLDSTYLIRKNLEDGNVVTPYYIEIENNSNKIKLEKDRIEKIINLFKKDYGDLIRDVQYSVNIYVKVFENTLIFKQIPIWILGLLYSNNKFLDEFQIGYVMNDDAISYIKDIKKIYYSYNSILEKVIPLKFPLIKYKKEMLLNELPQKYFDLTVTCEEPYIDDEYENGLLKYRPCGKCEACNRILYERNDKFLSDKYKDIKTKELLSEVRRLDKCEIKNKGDKSFLEIEYDDGPLLFSSAIKEKKSKEPKQLEIDFDYNDDIEINNKARA